MFQFLRRVSGSLLPRPDRPWREDATSHAPTIGRKRRYSLTDRDTSDSPLKRTKNDPPDTECDAASEGESTKGDALPPVERQDVKEVTKGVEEVDLEDRDKSEDPLSIPPEGIPLPDSPSASPGPESESPEDALEETKGEEVEALSLPEDSAEEGAEADPVAANTTTAVDGAQEATVLAVESDLRDAPDAVEDKE